MHHTDINSTGNNTNKRKYKKWGLAGWAKMLELREQHSISELSALYGYSEMTIRSYLRNSRRMIYGSPKKKVNAIH